jgi:RNA polymerase sigma factor (sigma-70 family)
MALSVKPDDVNPTRRSLLERVRNWDDHVSWEVFMKTYSPLVYSVALKAGLTHAEADDAVQETMISIAKNIREFHHDPAIGKFRNWVIKTTTFRVGDQLRKRKKLPTPRTRTRDEDRTATIDRVPDPVSLDVEKMCEIEWEKHIRDLAVEKLKIKIRPKHFQILDMYVLKEWPPAKVAKTAGVSTAFVYLVGHRVKKLLIKEAEELKKQAI